MKEVIEPTPPLLSDPTGRYVMPEHNRTAIIDTLLNVVIRCEDVWSAYHAFRAINERQTQ